VDFVSDQLASGRRFRVFNVVDDFTRECVLQIVDFSISGQRLANELDRLAATRRLPKTIVCDNGPELTAKAMFLWSQRRGVKLHFIQPGKPTQNAFVESFNARFREYCLDLNWFTSLEDARVRIQSWRAHYNHVRPHRSLGKKPPAVFAASVVRVDDERGVHAIDRLGSEKRLRKIALEPRSRSTSTLSYPSKPAPGSLGDDNDVCNFRPPSAA
jgi:putative transposase